MPKGVYQRQPRRKTEIVKQDDLVMIEWEHGGKKYTGHIMPDGYTLLGRVKDESLAEFVIAFLTKSKTNVLRLDRMHEEDGNIVISYGIAVPKRSVGKAFNLVGTMFAK